MGNEQRLQAFIEETRPKFEDLLGPMVDVPSVSMDSSRAGDMRRMAELAKQYLGDLGADPHIVETGGAPIVSGGWTTGAEYPTVTIYNHLDVQPAQEPEWKQSPFAFRNDRGIYHGRGATDDKGPALTALFGAKYAIERGVPINIRFLWELEEESGSPSLEGFIRDNAASLAADFVISADGGMWRSDPETYSEASCPAGSKPGLIVRDILSPYEDPGPAISRRPSRLLSPGTGDEGPER